jgi:hypothetical protein
LVIQGFVFHGGGVSFAVCQGSGVPFAMVRGLKRHAMGIAGP